MVPIMCMSRKDMHMHAALGMINGHGYNGQQKYICDACRQCHLILCILKPIFSSNSTDSSHIQLAQVPKSPDLAIFVSTTTTPHGVIKLILVRHCLGGFCGI